MALQTSGAISLLDIQNEFGGSNPIGINEYYGAASGIPASGTISLNQFYGASAYVAPTMTSTARNYRSTSNGTSYSYTPSIGAAPTGDNKRMVVVAGGNRGAYRAATVTIAGLATTRYFAGNNRGGADSPCANVAFVEVSSGTSASVSYQCGWGTGTGMTTWAITGIPLPDEESSYTTSSTSGTYTMSTTQYSWHFASVQTRSGGSASFGGGLTRNYTGSLYGSDYFNSASGQVGTGNGTWSAGGYCGSVCVAFNG